MSLGTYDDGNNCKGGGNTSCNIDAQIIHYTFGGSVGGHRHYGCGPDNQDDWATNVVVASNGDVYAVGAKACLDPSQTEYGHQFMVMKCYWESGTFYMDYPYCNNARYFNPEVDGGENIGVALTVDNNMNVYATGYSEGDGTSYDYLTIKFNTNGTHAWVSRYDGPGHSIDKAYDIKIDGSQNVYITGSSIDNSPDIATIIYNSSGVQQWVGRYDATSNIEEAYAIGLQGGNIHVAGVKNLGWFQGIGDFVTIKYSPSNDDDNSNFSLEQKTDNLIPKEWNLAQNYPNPFNPATDIKFGLPSNSLITLKIFDVLGREVASIINGENLEAGNYSYHFNASNLPSGIYYYKFTAGEYSDVKKMALIK